MKQLFCFLILLFCMSFSYEALAQEERATPKSGEGISGFLQRNGRTGKGYYQEFLELNKKQLRGKEELRLGVKYLLPPLKKGSGNTAASSNSSASNSSASNSSARSGNKTIREPLFGKSLAEVKVTGNRLKGACFYVVLQIYLFLHCSRSSPSKLRLPCVFTSALHRVYRPYPTQALPYMVMLQ